MKEDIEKGGGGRGTNATSDLKVLPSFLFTTISHILTYPFEYHTLDSSGQHHLGI